MTTLWTPIAAFVPEDFEDEEYLVWIVDEDGEGSPFLAQFHADLKAPEEGEEDDESEEIETEGEPRHQGEWRHIEELKDLEPVAFARVDPYVAEAEPKEEGDAEPDGDVTGAAV